MRMPLPREWPCWPSHAVILLVRSAQPFQGSTTYVPNGFYDAVAFVGRNTALHVVSPAVRAWPSLQSFAVCSACVAGDRLCVGKACTDLVGVLRGHDRLGGWPSFSCPRFRSCWLLTQGCSIALPEGFAVPTPPSGGSRGSSGCSSSFLRPGP